MDMHEAARSCAEHALHSAKSNLRTFFAFSKLSFGVRGQRINGVNWHPLNIGGCYFIIKRLVFIKVFKCEVVANISIGIKKAHIHIILIVDLIKYVSRLPVISSFVKVVILKLVVLNTGIGNDKRSH